MKAVTAYLNFEGNCREAMTFYGKCLGGKLEITKFSDMPGDNWGALRTDRFGIRWMFNFEHPQQG